jgi:hypothetical protein
MVGKIIQPKAGREKCGALKGESRRKTGISIIGQSICL